MAISKDPVQVRQAAEQLENKAYAPGSRAASGHRMQLWNDICKNMGYSDPVALTPEMVIEGAAVLHMANYRTAMAHVDQAVINFKENGGLPTPAGTSRQASTTCMRPRRRPSEALRSIAAWPPS